MRTVSSIMNPSQQMLTPALGTPHISSRSVSNPFPWPMYLGSLSSAGVENPFLGTVLVFVILLVFVVISWYTTDKFGRRPLLLGASSVIVVVLLLLGILGTIPRTGGTSTGLLVLALIWVAAYGTGISPIG